MCVTVAEIIDALDTRDAVAVEDAHARERPAPVTPARFVDNALRELT